MNKFELYVVPFVFIVGIVTWAYFAYYGVISTDKELNITEKSEMLILEKNGKPQYGNKRK